MIPAAYVQEWSQKAPWVGRDQVEWDMILTRVLLETFNHTLLREKVACRGGTVLNRVHLPSPVRFSEDIDLVQVSGEPIGDVIDAFRDVFEPLLGKPTVKRNRNMVTLAFRVEATEPAGRRLKIKLELNAREHFTVMGHKQIPMRMDSRWYSSEAQIVTYDVHELMGTKMRALHERKKGRDLFDLWYVSKHVHLDAAKVVECFTEYTSRQGKSISRADYEMTFRKKLRDRQFLADVPNLIAPGVAWIPDSATRYVLENLVPLLPGEAWRGTSE